MSRSIRQTARGPLAGGSNKEFRTIENKKKRRKETVVLKDIDNIDNKLPLEKEFGNEWKSPRDGKCAYYTEEYVRKAIDASIQTLLNEGKDEHSFNYNSYFDSYLIDKLKEYTKTLTVKELTTLSPIVINKFIKTIVKQNLKK